MKLNAMLIPNKASGGMIDSFPQVRLGLQGACQSDEPDQPGNGPSLEAPHATVLIRYIVEAGGPALHFERAHPASVTEVHPMNSFLWALVIFGSVGVGLWLVSFVIEAVRPNPKPPTQLRWAPDVPISSVEVGGNRLRYIKRAKAPSSFFSTRSERSSIYSRRLGSRVRFSCVWANSFLVVFGIQGLSLIP